MTARKIAASKPGGKADGEKSAPSEEVERKRARRKARRKQAAREADGSKKRSRGRGKKKRATSPPRDEEVAQTRPQEASKLSDKVSAEVSAESRARPHSRAQGESSSSASTRKRAKKKAARYAKPGSESRRKDKPATAGFPERIGRVLDCTAQSGLCTVVLEAGELQTGDTLRFHGEKTEFFERIERIECAGVVVGTAKPGDELTLSLRRDVHPGDIFFQLSS